MNIHHVVKVADFGLSVSMAEEKDYFRARDCSEKLPVKWMAPESLLDGKYSELSDVVSMINQISAYSLPSESKNCFVVTQWAFGVTCWEVMTCGGVPYPSLRAAHLLVQIRDGYIMKKPKNSACTDAM